MKKIKLFSIAAAFVAAFAFTSCNTGDDNNSYYKPLTQAQKSRPAISRQQVTA